MKTVYDSANDFTNYEQYFTIKERLVRLNQNMQKEKTMFNILLVVPYPKLEETARKVYQSYFQKEDFHVDIRLRLKLKTKACLQLLLRQVKKR